MSGAAVIYNRLTTGATSAITTEIAPRQKHISRGATPYVVYYRNQVQPNGTKLSTSVVDEETWILQCYADTYDGAAALAEAVRTDLDRIPAGTYSGVTVDGSHFTNSTDPEFDDDTTLFDTEVEVRIRVVRAGALPTS